MSKAIVTTSWDDGHRLDVRLAELLRKYGLKATFYVAPQNREFRKSDLLSDFQLRKLSDDFEIGAHTMTHPRLAQITAREADIEIGESKKYMERLLDKEVSSFCYPGGSRTFLNEQQVRKYGFKLARTVDRFEFKTGNDPYALPTSLHTYNHYSDTLKIARFAGYDVKTTMHYYKHWEDLGMAMFDHIRKEGGIFHLWGHSWEIDECHYWGRLDKIFSYISGHSDIEYKTNSELL